MLTQRVARKRFGQVWEIRAKIFRTPQNLPAPTPMPPRRYFFSTCHYTESFLSTFPSCRRNVALNRRRSSSASSAHSRKLRNKDDTLSAKFVLTTQFTRSTHFIWLAVAGTKWSLYLWMVDEGLSRILETDLSV